MTLHDFENYIESKILDRGFEYYEYDAVTDIEQVEKNEFVAQVLGSEEYNVFIKLNNEQKVIEHTCDCPYDWGDVCKHKVAVFYYLRDTETYNDPIKNSSIQKIQHNLQSLPKEEIIQMLIEISKRSKVLKDEILNWLS